MQDIMIWTHPDPDMVLLWLCTETVPLCRAPPRNLTCQQMSPPCSIIARVTTHAQDTTFPCLAGWQNHDYTGVAAVEMRRLFGQPSQWTMTHRRGSWTPLATSAIFGISSALAFSLWTLWSCQCSLWTKTSTVSILPWQWIRGLLQSTGSQTSFSHSSLDIWRTQVESKLMVCFLMCFFWVSINYNIIITYNIGILGVQYQAVLLGRRQVLLPLRKGALVTSRRKIAWNYVRSWFLPDIIVTIIDITLELLGSNNPSLQVGLSIRFWGVYHQTFSNIFWHEGCLKKQLSKGTTHHAAKVFNRYVQSQPCEHPYFAASEAFVSLRVGCLAVLHTYKVTFVDFSPCGLASRLLRVVRLGKLTRFAAFLRDRFETQARWPCKFWF